ncbi:MAG TPA: amidohydrolase [Caulifigura sp.]|nr:amidohydrolase [Caulifigura sp.]
MSDAPVPDAAVVDRCQTILAHAWMVRTFIKHSSEVEDFPELMGIVRNVFDLCLSVESRITDPPAYLHQLRKKLSKLKAAATQFAVDAPLASDHTNFKQAVISIQGCVRDLEAIVNQYPPLRPLPTLFRPAAASDKLAESSPSTAPPDELLDQ